MTYQKRNMIGSILYMTRNIDRLCSLYRHHAGIPASQSRILCFVALFSADHDIYQKDLEEEFAIRASSATGLVQALEQKGLIRRESVSSDARLKKIVLSDLGREIQSKIIATSEELQKQLQGNLSDHEVEHFIHTCEIITSNAKKGYEETTTKHTELSA